MGGGGHSAALLGALGSRARVVGLDRDPAALREASARLSTEVSGYVGGRLGYQVLRKREPVPDFPAVPC